MTVTRTTSLLLLFRTKIEEAVNLVPGMHAEEKLKAVQFWNVVSEKLQEIVNSSAADINAIAFKMDERNSNKITMEIDNGSSNTLTPNNVCVSDFMGLTPNYSVCSGSANSYDTSLKQVLSNSSDSAASMDETVNRELTTLQNIQSTAQTCSKDSNKEGDFLAVQSLSPDNCGDYSQCQGEISKDLLHNVSNSSNCDQGKMFPKDSISNNENLLNNTENAKILKRKCSNSMLKHLILRNNNVPQNSRERFESSYLSESSKDSYSGNKSDLDSVVNLEESNESNNTENIVSFVVSNTEEILSTNETMQQKSDKNDVFVCEICDEIFTHSHLLTNHRWIHIKPHACSQCSALFASKGNLIVHFRKHSGEKPYCCTKCNSRFATKGNLKRHVKTHSGDKPWQCNQCGGCFTEKKSLNVHMRRHTGERPYQCKICGKKFAQTGVLQTHMAMHTDQKLHLCEHCGKSFRQKSQLRIHRLRHEGERKHLCLSCPSRFLTRGDLERHSRTHTGERPFICELCGKTFTRQQSLNEHMNRHYGLRPYECKYCNRTFAEMSACYKHVKGHGKTLLQEVKEGETKNSDQPPKSDPGIRMCLTESIEEQSTQNFSQLLKTNEKICLESQTNTLESGESQKETNHIKNTVSDFMAVNFVTNSSTQQIF